MTIMPISYLVQASFSAVLAVVDLYKALGGGWEGRNGLPYLDSETLQLMQDRTDWGDMLETGYSTGAGEQEQE